MRITKAEREFRKHRLDHDFILGQGSRENDDAFLASHQNRRSAPTQHGAHLMRSALEAQWAEQFERRGFTQAPINSIEVYPVPCYFFEPYGMKRWPTYHKGKHYRIDFVLVYELHPYLKEGQQQFCAMRWEWISIKPDESDVDAKLFVEIAEDRQHLIELVKFDSLHQRAMQLCGPPMKKHRIYTFTYDAATKTCKTGYVDREGVR